MTVLSGSVFDEIATIYDRARRPYPSRLFDDLFSYLHPGGMELDSLAAVEIGPGTGQATGQLLARGATVAAVEAGPRLAALLRHKFAGEQRLAVINERFESAPLPGGLADLVVAALSFDWLDRDIRYQKVLSVLKPGGVLALIGVSQITSTVDRGFFQACQPIYDRHVPGSPAPEPADEGVTPAELPELLEFEDFGRVELFRYRWDQEYSAEEYRDLVESYSTTQPLRGESRRAFLTDLLRLIDDEFDGFVVRPLVLTLLLATVTKR